MREAIIILPRDYTRATQACRTLLLDAFGGYTEHAATGAWRDPKDGVVYYDHNSVFTIGADDTDGIHMLTLRGIALTVGDMADQQSVYLRGFDGNVEFVNCSHVPATQPEHATA